MRASSGSSVGRLGRVEPLLTKLRVAPTSSVHRVAPVKLIWSREVNQDFPEIKQVKQLVRDRDAPNKDLGHSDVSR